MKKIKDDNILDILEQSKISNAKIHLSFLFASPLVNYEDYSNKFYQMIQIDHNKETSSVLDSLGQTSKQIKYQKVQATLVNITQTLTESPIALHFSGHGVKNIKTTSAALGGGNKERGGLQGYLVIENENGEANFLHASDLKKMINAQGTQPEFVFVASCHSEFAGQIFHKAGAKHVICIKEEQAISDDAAICFAKIFYNALFSSSKTVCEAFQIAKRHLQTHDDDDIAREAEKFILLCSSDEQQDEIIPEDLIGMNLTYYNMMQQQQKKKSHQCTIFGQFDPGSLTYVGKPPLFRIDTSKVEDFIGRTSEMHQVIKNIHKKRIVNVKGVPGIGKTTLIKAVAHYLDERQIMRDGIIMLSLRNLDNTNMILTRLELQISKKVKDFITENDVKNKDENKTDDQTGILEKIASFFKDKNILFILDNAETPSKKDPINFTEMISVLLEECPQVSFLFTSRYNVGTFGCHSEQSIELKELEISHAVELLKRKSPRQIEHSEINELLSVKPNKMLGMNPMREQKGGLENHHMFQILRGHPHAISLAAPLLENKTLKELYDILNSDKIMNWLRSQDMKDSEMSSTTSLKVSMDISINQLQETDPQAIKLFWLIGLMPGGCKQSDLDILWGENWLSEAEKLLRSSLLVRKNPGEDSIYQLFPFMNWYAETNMDQ